MLYTPNWHNTTNQLHINEKQGKKENNSSYNRIKKNNKLRTKLTKKVQDWYTENIAERN